jgi:hypothetical protein
MSEGVNMESVRVEGDWVIFRRTDEAESEFAIRIDAVRTIERRGKYVSINGEDVLASFEDSLDAVILGKSQRPKVNKNFLLDNKAEPTNTALDLHGGGT